MKVKLKLFDDGIQGVLKSTEVMNALKDEANKIGEIDSCYVGIYRANVAVRREKGNADRTDR